MTSYTSDPGRQDWPGSNDPNVPGTGSVAGDPYGASTPATGTDTWADPATGTGSTGGSDDSTKDVAKQEAGQVKNTAVDAGRDVAGTAKEEAAGVAGEAKERAADLVGTVTTEVRTQIGSQQQRLAGGLHSVASELGEMASKAEGSGPGSQLAQEASRRIGSAAHWFENREPADVLDEVRDFARRRPGLFLGGMALAGLVVGRLTRDVVASRTDLDNPGSTGSSGSRGLSGDASAWSTPPAQAGGYVEPGYASTGYATTGYSTAPAGTPTGQAGYTSSTDAPASMVEEDLTDPQSGYGTGTGTSPWVDDTRGGAR
ncbi:hypothetical protein [Auraticoccus monumenti]|uniref:Uncharacterized protein n=1 Tax=Auraticoccus monumenti TaxID=675864 RepID=A0A1G6YYH3_9ACTN|nr:hypothetical protein [Auraticoccus monumenti]SDD95408.1 hypothetical protein SAMN04489747_2135 [Auraticoccus monumenti]